MKGFAADELRVLAILFLDRVRGAAVAVQPTG